jgi:hypothetical protein
MNNENKKYEKEIENIKKEREYYHEHFVRHNIELNGFYIIHMNTWKGSKKFEGTCLKKWERWFCLKTIKQRTLLLPYKDIFKLYKVKNKVISKVFE